MNDIYQEIALLLFDLEAELRRLQLWDTVPPDPQALQSDQPFCIDTLAFYQWVQFMLLPRMAIIIDARAALPLNSAIAPMAEEYFRGMTVSGEVVIELLRRFDVLLSG